MARGRRQQKEEKNITDIKEIKVEDKVVTDVVETPTPVEITKKVTKKAAGLADFLY